MLFQSRFDLPGTWSWVGEGDGLAGLYGLAYGSLVEP